MLANLNINGFSRSVVTKKHHDNETTQASLQIISIGRRLQRTAMRQHSHVSACQFTGGLGGKRANSQSAI